MAAKRVKKGGGGSRGIRPARFSAEEARDAILAATERRLLEVGPQGLRLQEIARDVGLSHPTVIHHFGSRQGLVEAVAARAMQRLERDLVACFADLEPNVDPEAVTLDILERVDQVMRVRGHARAFAWLALTKLEGPAEPLLRELALAIQSARKARGIGGDDAEATTFSVLLGSAAMFGVALLGPHLHGMLGLPADEPTYARFRRWLATLFVAELRGAHDA